VRLIAFTAAGPHHARAVRNLRCYHVREAMQMATTTRPRATEADLLSQPADGNKYELVDGEIRVSPGGARHGRIEMKLGSRIETFVTANRLGHVFGSSVGFRLPGGNVRSPDLSFVSAGRFPAEQVPDAFADLAPDLAVEVVSPGDRARYVLEKVGEYLDAGVRLVWVIDPKKGKAIVYRSLSDARELGRQDALDGEDVLPGFSVTLVEIL
jgi:Uma2 family endonuclease